MQPQYISAYTCKMRSPSVQLLADDSDTINTTQVNLDDRNLNRFQNCLRGCFQKWKSWPSYNKFVLYHASIVTAFLFIIFSNLMFTSIKGKDKKPQVISCFARPWYGRSMCGLNGEYCRPFKTSVWQLRPAYFS